MLSTSTTTCKNKQQNSWQVEGGFPQTLGDSIDHPDASRVKNPTLEPWGLPETNHEPWLSLVDYLLSPP